MQMAQFKAVRDMIRFVLDQTAAPGASVGSVQGRKRFLPPNGRRFTDPDSAALPAGDLDYCAVADCIDFALRVRRADGNLVMEPVA